MATGFETFTGTAVKQSVLPKSNTKTISNNNNNNNNNNYKVTSNIPEGILKLDIKPFDVKTYNEPYITTQLNDVRKIVASYSPEVTKVTVVPSSIVEQQQKKLDSVGIISDTPLIYPSGSYDSGEVDAPKGLDTLSSGNNTIDKLTIKEKETIIKTQEFLKDVTTFPKLPDMTGIFEQIGKFGKFALIGLGGLIIFNLTRRS